MAWGSPLGSGNRPATKRQRTVSGADVGPAPEEPAAARSRNTAASTMGNGRRVGTRSGEQDARLPHVTTLAGYLHYSTVAAGGRRRPRHRSPAIQREMWPRQPSSRHGRGGPSVVASDTAGGVAVPVL